MDGLGFFDRQHDFTVTRRRLPHWSQDGTLVFITWRTADSLPKEVLRQLAVEREALLREYGIEDDRVSARRGYGTRVSPRRGYGTRVSPRRDSSERSSMADLPPLVRRKLQWKLFHAWDERLDRAAGACVLVQPKLAAIVEEAVLRFDGERYVVTDMVVMPNHVHVLAAFADAATVDARIEGWKRFSARRINVELGRRGEFWQVEQFDHLVRSAEQFGYLRDYIAKNPVRAKLAPGTWRHYVKAL